MAPRFFVFCSVGRQKALLDAGFTEFERRGGRVGLMRSIHWHEGRDVVFTLAKTGAIFFGVAEGPTNVMFAADHHELHACPACEIGSRLCPVMHLDDESNDPFAIRGVEKAMRYMKALKHAQQVLRQVSGDGEAAVVPLPLNGVEV